MIAPSRPPRLALLLCAAAALAASACSSGGASGGSPPPPPVCTAGATRACYAGPAGTLDVGACQAGAETCAADGSAWGACLGQVLPAAEVCGDGVDQDCNGSADDSLDQDGDGWARCDGDCDDAVATVNPGAYDLAGDGVDDDCSGTADDAATACSDAAVLSGVTAGDLAQALDVCQATTQAPPLSQRRWGLIASRLALADGTGTPDAAQTAVLATFGTQNLPLRGGTLAVLTSGKARGSQASDWVSPFGAGYATANQSGAPADLLAAFGGILPHAAACPAPAGTTVFDPVRLELDLRAPTNAQGLRFRFRFYASDWPDNACSAFNDTFVAQLTSTAPGLPPGGSISFAPNGDPISVNGGLITTCASGTGCTAGTLDLNGSGYHSLVQGGATSWLQTSAPVLGGETLRLSFNVWDNGDTGFDSLVIVEGFEWLFAPTTVETVPVAP